MSTALGRDSRSTEIGIIPSEWRVSRIKDNFQLINGYPFDSKKFDLENGFPLLRIRDLNKNSTETLYNGEWVESVAVSSSDLLIGMDGDFNVGRWFGHQKALLNQRTCCLRGKEFLTKFIEYYLPVELKKINDVTYATTVKHLSSLAINKIKFPLPPLVELQKIVEFLDYETLKIDELIKKQEQLISLSTERYQAAISYAITKGFESKAKLKDSGIKWIGEIPDHWSVIPLKRLCSLLKDGTHLPPARVDKGVPLLSVRNLQNSNFGFLEDDSQISEESYVELSRSFTPEKDDILLAIVGATIGKTALIPADMGAFHIQRSLAIFRVNHLLTPAWLWRSFQSTGFQSLLWEQVGFSAQPGIYLGSLSEFKMPIPPLEEQTVILEKLDLELTKIKLLIDKSKSSVELLKEHRASLISAAVTGKIDVRELA